MDIKRNSLNGGYFCYFEHKGNQYYADVAWTPDHGNECMIFPAKDNRVTDWGELYAKTAIPVSEESLKDCIEEFKKML